MTTETITWVLVTEGLPDDDETVLLYAPEYDEPVWVGWRDGDEWRDMNGHPTDGVAAWAPMPAGPQQAQEAAR